MGKSYDKMSRDELLAACIEEIISMTDDEFALLKKYWDAHKAEAQST